MRTNTFFQRIKTPFVRLSAKIKQLGSKSYYKQKWYNVTHLNFKVHPSIHEIKKRARQNIHRNFRMVCLAGLIRAAILIMCFVTAFPTAYQLLDIQAKVADNSNLAVPAVDTTLLWLGAAGIILAIVLFDVLLTVRLLPNNSPNKESDRELFGFEWINASLNMIINRFIWACAGVIPFIITVLLADAENSMWPVMLGITVLTSIFFYLKSRYTYSLSIIESITGYLDSKQAMQVSRQHMYGHRLQLMMVMLSFILWDICNLFLCGMLSVYLAPYKIATIIEFRKELLRK